MSLVQNSTPQIRTFKTGLTDIQLLLVYHVDVMVNKIKNRRFDQNLQPVTANAFRCCEDIFNQLQNYETHFKIRKRARKKIDQEIFQQTVYCIISNLVLSAFGNPDSGVRITRSHSHLGTKDRYRTPVLGKTFPTVIDLMTKPEMTFLIQDKATASTSSDRQQTIIYPSDRIRTRLIEYDLHPEDFGPGEFPEVIILKGKKGGFFEKSGVQQYEDTPLTNKMRSEVDKINDWLVAMDIDIALNDVTSDINTNNRKLRRYFTRGDLTFNSGGRLFGGFWLEMSKKNRRDYLWLGDEQTCTLDFNNLGPTILYGLAKSTPPEGDAYRVSGFERYRSGIKLVFNCMTFTDAPLKRFPKGVKKEFEQEHRFHWVVHAIKKKHKPIFHLLNSQVGHHIQKIESDIIVKCMLIAQKQDIPALPVHDALIFPRSKKEEGIRIMETAFKTLVGVQGQVKEEI